MISQATLAFEDSGLDRAAYLRAGFAYGDRDQLSQYYDGGAECVVPFWQGKPLLCGSSGSGVGAAWLASSHPVFEYATEAAVFLGMDEPAEEGGRPSPRFARDVSAWQPAQDAAGLQDFLDCSRQVFPGLKEGQSFSDLRANMCTLASRDAELLATAKAVLGWHQSHKFCACCGAQSQPVQAGWQRSCPDCGAQHFPRTDPVVIMLITCGNAALVGRSPGWPEGMYSCLAGFVEPGETLEAAVRRETLEETGVRVGRVSYLVSQPWPFPSSLMIGCHGEAETSELILDPNEIEDACWVSREEMMDCFSGLRADMTPARNGSIAHFMLLNWLKDTI